MDLGTAAHTALARVVAMPQCQPLPEGRYVDLPGRGRTFAVHVEGPPGAPTLLLLHALGCTGYLTWFPFLDELRTKYSLVLMDQRWHGRGITAGRHFSLEECADDAAALLQVLGVDEVIPVGYSMGGVVAQLFWHRHRKRTTGLVLGATARNFRGGNHEKWFFRVMPVAHLAASMRHHDLPPVEGGLPVTDGMDPKSADIAWRRWAMSEFRRTKMSSLVAAVDAIGAFSSHDWIGGVDVPTSVVVTTHDRAIPTRRQYKLAAAIPGATLHEYDGGHGSIVLGATGFGPVLHEAIDTVAGRIAGTSGERVSA